MANISFAQGFVTLKGNKEHVNQMVAFINKYARHWRYATRLEEAPINIEEISEEMVEATYRFEGKGRYKYLDTVKSLFSMLNAEISANHDPIEVKIWDELVADKEFTMIFNFVDSEYLNQILYTCVLELSIEKTENGKIDSCEISVSGTVYEDGDIEEVTRDFFEKNK